jgi:hypothetical protein
MAKINYFISLANDIYRREGIFRLILALSSQIYKYQIWYVYEHDLSDILKKNEKELLPKVPGFSIKIVSSIEQAKELERNGFDLIKKASRLIYRLKNGAIAFCLFNETKLMHIGWVAMNTQAKESLTHVPYKVDFSKMACIEVATTMPEYKGKNVSKYFPTYKGFMTYSFFKRAQFLITKGYHIARYSILESNKASRWFAERYNIRVISKIHHIRILGFMFWKESKV